MIFTSTVPGRSQSTSQQFKDYGNENQAPCSVSAASISPLRVIHSVTSTLVCSYLWAFVLAFLTGDMDAKIRAAPGNGLASPLKVRLFPAPPMVVTFTVGNNKENVATKMEELGFTKQSSGRYNYYKGPASDLAIDACLKLGAESDCYATYGLTNIAGIICLSIINRFLHAACGFLCHIGSNAQHVLELPDGDNVEVSAAGWKEYAITGPESLSSHGIFFPYFDGLTIPDKSSTPRTFLALFTLVMGSTGTLMAAASTNFIKGWQSLSSTPAGVQAAHLIFGVDLAIKTGVNLRPVFLNNRYRGFVLEGQKFAIFKDSTVHKPVPKEKLAEELALLNSHNDALAKLAELLSATSLDAPFHKDKDGKDITSMKVAPEHIASPRHLHYLCKIRTFDSQAQNSVRTLAGKLHFEETFWDVQDKAHLVTCITHIIRGDFLPVEAPFAYRSSLLFTKDPVYSNLCAYGQKAPTLLGLGNNVSMPITADGKFYEKVQAHNFNGIPVFAKAIQQAAEDWDILKRQGVITLKSNGNDKSGRAKVTGIFMTVPRDTDYYKRIVSSLKTIAETKKKRVRESGESDNVGKVPGAAPIEKKRKTGMDLLSMVQLEGVIPSVVVPEEVDAMDEDDFFSN